MRWRTQAARLRLALRGKIGSSVVVKGYQNRTFREIAAQSGGFFVHFAQQNPDVFRREMGNWARREPRFFVTAASGGVHGKIKEHTN